MSGSKNKQQRKANKSQSITTGDFCKEMVGYVEERLGPSSLKGRAAAFQALAIMCFQRSTELSADVIIEAVDTAFNKEMGIPPSSRNKIMEGVRMFRHQNALGIPLANLEKKREVTPTEKIVSALKVGESKGAFSEDAVKAAVDDLKESFSEDKEGLNHGHGRPESVPPLPPKQPVG